jgi:hypothetical protein
MKNSNKMLLVLLVFLFIPAVSFAQLIKIGAGGGITKILAPNHYTDDVADAPTNTLGDGGLGFSTEWNVAAIVKVDLPLVPITPRAFFTYNSLSGSGDIVEYKSTISEIGAGVQYNFIPAPLGFDPYVALDLSFNTFSNLEANGNEIGNSFTRFGGGIGIGTEVSIIPVVNLDLYLSYKMFNLTGKEDAEETVSAVTLDAFIIFNFL